MLEGISSGRCSEEVKKGDRIKNYSVNASNLGKRN
jgi:hypothetical protein